MRRSRRRGRRSGLCRSLRRGFRTAIGGTGCAEGCVLSVKGSCRQVPSGCRSTWSGLRTRPLFVWASRFRRRARAVSQDPDRRRAPDLNGGGEARCLLDHVRRQLEEAEARRRTARSPRRAPSIVACASGWRPTTTSTVSGRRCRRCGSMRSPRRDRSPPSNFICRWSHTADGWSLRACLTRLDARLDPRGVGSSG